MVAPVSKFAGYLAPGRGYAQNPSEKRVQIKKFLFDLLHAKKSARIFEKNPQKSIFSLLEGSNGFHLFIQS